MTSMQTLKKKPSLNPVLRPFWQTKARNKILYGGRASSKSWDAAGFAVFLANRYKLRFLCVRQLQNKIEESVYSLLKIQIERFGLQGNFRVLNNKIINTQTGSEFMFYGLWRHIDEIKSIESVDVLWSEESHALTETQWEVLEPTIRKEGSECWIIFNPNLVSDFVWQNFVVDPPANTVVRHINYNENPFLSNTALAVIDDKKKRDPDSFGHIYLGNPRDDDDMSIIKASWVEAAIDAHKLLGLDDIGRSYLGFDVADAGKDKCALIHRKGIVAHWSDEWKSKEDELLKSAIRTYSEAVQRDAYILYDSTGVGAGAGAKFNELNEERELKVNHAKFVAGGGVFEPDEEYQPKITNKDFFANMKAQAWWLVADRFRLTYQVVTAMRNGTEIPNYKIEDLISISSEMPNMHRLKVELSIPRRAEDRLGRVMVESKQDLAKRDIKSPNLADAFIMAYAPIVGKPMVINPDVLKLARMRRR